MNQSYSSAYYKLIRKIETLHKLMQQSLADGTTTFLNKKHQLQKRYERCLNKLATLTSPVVKSGAAFGLTLIIHSSTTAQKQSCNTFHQVIKSNPLTRVPLNYNGLGKPAFVDIDGDGDYDCYEEYYDDPKNGSGLHPSHIIFLRNNGTKDIPYFQQDTTSGFAPDFTFVSGLFPSEIEGTVFVDIDKDGDYDCLIGAYVNGNGYPTIKYFENTGTKTVPHFTERTGAQNPFAFVGGYYRLFYTLADLDSDGDYDLVTSTDYFQGFYKNIGNAKKPFFKLEHSEYFLGGSPYVFYDWNKDGLLDQFYLNLYYQNIGTPSQPKFKISNQGPVLPIDIQQFVDINNDGFIDLFSYAGNFATTSPDAFIQTDSAHNALQAYPKDATFIYRWQRNGKQIPGATTPHFTPKIPGMYTVEITGSCGTGVSYPYAYKTTQKTLLDEAGNSSSLPLLSLKTLLPLSDIKTYPNPFTHSFILQLDNKYPLYNISIRICDIEGRIVQTIRPNRYSLSMGEPLAKGLFVIQVWQNGAVVYQQKILKE